MSATLLKELGITKEELQNRVVERLCDRVMGTVEYGEDGDGYSTDSMFSRKLQKEVEAAVDLRISAIAAKYVDPKVEGIVENLTIHKTNSYGEKRGEPMSFIEYMVSRAEAYLQEPVDYEGKPVTGYGTKSQTRVSHIVDKNLHYTINQQATNAVKTVNSALAEGIAETVKIKLEEIVKGLKVSVVTK